ncbi:MAG TPA: ATP-binding cassette domain-containing protein [Chloroflexia bacterium]|nr:ATP-binding cassette domain-containing protein [Chloroflexia bacterium]
MITFEHVSKTYPSHNGGELVRAVNDLNVQVDEGELCVLIGPSGSGKTTAMRMVNRLVIPTEGRISVNGQDNSTMDPVLLRRSIGYVIQQVGLFPHLTVAENVGIVPRLLGWEKSKRRERANELLELVGLPPAKFADRHPRQLSGGQQQRVGVARALAADPEIILMDEPFGAVDPITRKQLQRELRRIQSEVHKTILFVTHDISEAFLLADRIVLMYRGRLIQNGTPAELLRHPVSEFVTDFIGEDQGLRVLQYTTLSEIASSAPHPLPTGHAVGTGADGNHIGGPLLLPQSMSVLDGLRHLAAVGHEAPDEILLQDKQDEITGIITNANLVMALSEAITSGETEEQGIAGGNNNNGNGSGLDTAHDIREANGVHS